MRRYVVLPIAAMLLAACSGTPQVAPTGPPRSPTPATLSPTATPSGSVTPVTIDPCALADSSDVHAAAGGTVAAPQHDQRNPQVPGCIWALTGSTLGQGSLLVVVTGTGADQKDFAAVQAASPKPVAVQAIGDAAFYDESIGQLVLLQHGTIVTLAAAGFVLHAADPPSSDIEKVLTTLAKPVAGNL